MGDHLPLTDKSSIVVAHDCDALLKITLRFESFSGEYVTTDVADGLGCMLDSLNYLTCEVEVASGNSEAFAIMSEG